MRPSHVISCVAMAVVLAVGFMPRVKLALADDAVTCTPRTIEIDTSYAQAKATAFLGSAVGQSFFAADTLIQSISVWRWEPGGDGGFAPPMKLWITGTTSTGIPTPELLLLEGPTVRVPADSGPPRAIKVRYAFDPPFALPRRGLYAFFLQDPCLLIFSVLMDTSRNVYPEGQFFQTGRDVSHICTLNYVARFSDYLRIDLIFEIEFCSEAATPVRRNTWGRLKVIYR